MIVLVGGGSRSGKTRFALEYVTRCGQPLAYIATAEIRDEEMRERAANHQRERGHAFETIEEPYNLSRVFKEQGSRYRGIVVDCLTIWLSNMMLSDPPQFSERASSGMLRVASELPGTVVFVTNEVGCGIVPENELARRFRDAAGWLNQEAARAASEVYWTVFGCPVRVK